MHCNGCARKVEKHISKMDGMKCLYNFSNFHYHFITATVCARTHTSAHYANNNMMNELYNLCISGVTSYQIDLETKMVVIMGDIVPFEVVESVAKVKNAEFWKSTSPELNT